MADEKTSRAARALRRSTLEQQTPENVKRTRSTLKMNSEALLTPEKSVKKTPKKTPSARKSRPTKSEVQEQSTSVKSPEASPQKSQASQALKARHEEFEKLSNWITESINGKSALSIYISGQPGTGKTATTKRVLSAFGKKIRSCIVNCASISSKTALLKEIFVSQNLTQRLSQDNFEKLVNSLSTPLVLVLDEIDHLASKTNAALYSAFRWPYTLSHKIIIIGIANSIDLTERLLPKLMLTEPPKRLIFEPYTKEDIVDILADKMANEQIEIDKKAVELCARKVAAMSGDLRTALHIFKQTKNRLYGEQESAPETNKNGCREVLGVLNSVYSSPLARARLPMQPRILLAVCLALSNNKQSSFDRGTLMKAYAKACDAIRAPVMDDDDLMAAFQNLESQSFIREINGGKLVLQVDSATAKSAISDNSMLDQIAMLNL
ncbi:unnamed protein product [Caenorhabditis bovis]|uniref:AAA+ ATPase domain-containing protein n=1 Tax=Caenorhabditis bovis TaxID=2654633 RepID=A0A8S1F4I2_9PELO|nr:unnamed protein product [Caenorhabditis bovis]